MAGAGTELYRLDAGVDNGSNGVVRHRGPPAVLRPGRRVRRRLGPTVGTRTVPRRDRPRRRRWSTGAVLVRGTFVGAGGAADGVTMIDIGVSENGSGAWAPRWNSTALVPPTRTSPGGRGPERSGAPRSASFRGGPPPFSCEGQATLTLIWPYRERATSPLTGQEVVVQAVVTAGTPASLGSTSRRSQLTTTETWRPRTRCSCSPPPWSASRRRRGAHRRHRRRVRRPSGLSSLTELTGASVAASPTGSTTSSGPARTPPSTPGPSAPTPSRSASSTGPRWWRRSATSPSSIRPSIPGSSTPRAGRWCRPDVRGDRHRRAVHGGGQPPQVEGVGFATTWAIPDTGRRLRATCNGAPGTLAAQALVDWLATDPTGSGDIDALIIGDLNSYDKEDPIDAIRAGSDDLAGTGDDFTDLVAPVPRRARLLVRVRRPGSVISTMLWPAPA